MAREILIQEDVFKMMAQASKPKPKATAKAPAPITEVDLQAAARELYREYCSRDLRAFEAVQNHPYRTVTSV